MFVTFWVIAIRVKEGTVVAIFILDGLVQVVVHEVEVGGLLANVILVTGHADQVNLTFQKCGF